MGLLDKALNFRSGTEKRVPGLLERAKKLKDFIQGKDKDQPPVRAESSNSGVAPKQTRPQAAPATRGGLFKRALAAKTPSTAGGLLKRAESLQSEDAGTFGSSGQPGQHSPEPPAEIDFSSPDLASTDLDSPDLSGDLSHSDFDLPGSDLYIAPARPDLIGDSAHESSDFHETAPSVDTSKFATSDASADPMILDIDLPDLPESDFSDQPFTETAAPKDLSHSHSDDSEHKPGGLLARAEQLKGDVSSTESSDLAEPAFDTTLDWDSKDAPELDLPDFDSPRPASSFEQDVQSDSAAAAAEDLPGLWNELESPANDADLVDHELSQADEAAREHAESLAATDDFSPEESWDEASDPFSTFEQEAEKAAERELASNDDKPHEEKVQPSFLFDADDDFTTAPIEAHIAGQKKIDHYLSLFDIQREISGIDNFEEFWDSVLFAVMGQLGAETVCILASRNGTEGGQTFLPVAYSGMEIGDKWALGPGDTLYDSASTEDGVMYAESFRNLSDAMTLTEIERDMIVQSRAQIIAPLKNNGKMYGIIFLGGTHSGEDYGIDDLEFVTLLGGIAASGVDRIIARLEFARGTEVLKKRDFYHNRILEAARECSSGANLDELYDIVGRNLTEHFSVDSYSIVLLNPSTQEYSIFAGNRISPESIEKFKLRTTSELIGMVSNFTRVFEISDFRTNSELTACYTNDDLGIMKSYWIVPLIYQNWLVGFITVHSTRAPWTEFEREMIVSFAELVSASFGGAIMMGERESLFRDPFSPLEDRLRVELGRAFEFHSHLSLAEIRIKNIKRILTLNPSANVTQFLSSVGRTISGFLFQTDFLARIGQGRFALILPGRGKEEAEILIKKIRNDIKRLHLLPGSPVDAQFVHTIVSTDDTHDPEKMLAILE
ncbi:MAG: GAF domain-containing protein [Leptospirales bacterium]|nr:GAF domain-containing protein [Leptospirales bacterium]